MNDTPKVLAKAEVGQELTYQHFQVHPQDEPALKQFGFQHPYPKVAWWEFELWTTGKEADVMDWFQTNWYHSIVYSIIYMILIVLGQRIMKNRDRFDLRLALILWSGSLAISSTVATIRCGHEMIHRLLNHGFFHSVCNPCCYYGTAGMWGLIFTLSKVWELGDTVFIVLRKQPLIFLHWYHHVTVLCYTWIAYGHHAGPGRWFTVMNLFVHSVMYSYYTARAARFRVPRIIMMCITILQLSQMVVGLYVSIYAYYIKSQGGYCHFSTSNMYWAFAMYLSYFLLFINYFYRTYLKPQVCLKPTRNGAVTVTETKNGTAHSNGLTDTVHANGTCHSNESVITNGHVRKRM